MKILGPAIAGAAMQLMAIGLLMVLFYFLASAGYFFLGWPFALCEDETACQAAAPLVRLSYLITAVGIALTNTPFFAQTKCGHDMHLARSFRISPNFRPKQWRSSFRS